MENKVMDAPMYGKRVYTDTPVIGTAFVGEGEEGAGTPYHYIKEMTQHEEEIYMGDLP